MALRNVAWWALVAGGMALLAGCSEKLSYERWQTLNEQSSKAEVETILGDPNQYKKEDRWMYHNPDKQITVNVEFAGDDKITYSRWVDPDHGTHEIGKAAIEGPDVIQRDTHKMDKNP